MRRSEATPRIIRPHPEGPLPDVGDRARCQWAETCAASEPTGAGGARRGRDQAAARRGAPSFAATSPRTFAAASAFTGP